MTGSNTGLNTLGPGGLQGDNSPRITPADAAGIATAAAILSKGGLAALPTETVYGLAADASNADAVAGIYRAKGRPDFNPLITHIADKAAGEALAIFDERAHALADAFWPGALTMVLPLRPGAGVAAAVTAGLPSIALRCPAHPVMQAVLRESGLCLAAPSANKSGQISPTLASHVASSMGGEAPLILDGGACEAGLESTILALRDNGWQLLRQGPIAEAEIEAFLGEAPLPVTEEKIEAPGMLARHYAPGKPLRLNAETASGDEWHIGFGDIAGDDNLSADADMAQAAAKLFAALHSADASARAAIAVAPIPVRGMGAAINDRLMRAAAR